MKITLGGYTANIREMDRQQLAILVDNPENRQLTYRWTKSSVDAALESKAQFFDIAGSSTAFGITQASDPNSSTSIFDGKQVTIRCTVIDGAESVFTEWSLTLKGNNRPPVAIIDGIMGTPDNRLESGSRVVPNASRSYDPDKTNPSFQWFIGEQRGGSFKGVFFGTGMNGERPGMYIPDMDAPIDQDLELHLLDGLHRVVTKVTAYLKPKSTTEPTRLKLQPPTRYVSIENEHLKAVFDLEWGGVLTDLFHKTNPAIDLVNSFDNGRQIQMAIFDDTWATLKGDPHRAPEERRNHINPTQGGQGFGGTGSPIFEYIIEDSRARFKLQLKDFGRKETLALAGEEPGILEIWPLTKWYAVCEYVLDGPRLIFNVEAWHEYQNRRHVLSLEAAAIYFNSFMKETPASKGKAVTDGVIIVKIPQANGINFYSGSGLDISTLAVFHRIGNFWVQPNQRLLYRTELLISAKETDMARLVCNDGELQITAAQIMAAKADPRFKEVPSSLVGGLVDHYTYAGSKSEFLSLYKDDDPTTQPKPKPQPTNDHILLEIHRMVKDIHEKQVASQRIINKSWWPW